jgi:hypothetical protein
VASDQRTYVVDLSGQAPICITVAQPDGRRAGAFSDVTESGRYLVYANVLQPRGPSHDLEIVLADLEEGTARSVARVSGASGISFVAATATEKVLVTIRSAESSRADLFLLDATLGTFQRLLPRSLEGVFTPAVSPFARHVAFSAGPPPPPQPPQPESTPRPRDNDLGCDPIPCPPGACGWFQNGCWGYDYCGDCPSLQRARQEAERNSHTYLLRVPDR